MKKVVALLLLGGFMALNNWASPAQALPPFKKAFDQKYVANSTDANFKAAAKAAGCNICHVKDKEKTERNEYGAALAKVTGGKVKADLDAAATPAAKKAIVDAALKNLQKAFQQVEADKSAAGPTFGEQIKAGKLPAG